ncbi:MAG: hypothetical protein IKC03_00695 [Oscillospiraceae bacterium]|nr:hypothetical protein [Oscillospiraceae bacterium]
MTQNNRPDLQKLLNNRKTIEHLTQSPDAQALKSMLTEGHNAAELEKMAHNAMSGDPSALQSLVRSITDTPGGTELLRRLSESLSGK